MKDLVESAELTLHGRIVEKAEGGLGSLFGTLFKVEPIEWVRSDAVPSDALSPHYFYLKEYEFDLDGVVICSSRDGFWSFEVGDEVLLLGTVGQRPERFFSVGHAFPVQDGLVISQPYPGISAEHLPVPIVSLR